jgi:hypothetical protein
MAVLEPRSKLISFRLSEQEYRSFVAISETRGARSVSEAARNAVIHNLLGVKGGGNRVKTRRGSGVESRVFQLQGRVEELDREVKRLATMVAGPPA